jgi:hypothetical protein
MKIFATIFICVNVFCVSITTAQESVPVGLQKQLLVDDYVIAKKQNITRELGHVEKLGPVLGPDIPTDFTLDGRSRENLNPWFAMRLTVLWNELDKKYQMWYRAGGEAYTGYAESENGINWIKPLIGMGGGTNLIPYRGADHGTFFESAVMIDPTDPWGHPEKYKAAYNPGDPWDCEAAIAYSSDGIHWRAYNNGEPVTGRAADTFNQIIWDPIARRYMLITRTDLGSEGGATEERAARIMVHGQDNDLMNYPEAWVDPVIVRVDDPAQESTPAGVPVLQMESMNIWIYENIYFSLMHVLTMGELTASGGKIPVDDPHARPESYVIDYYLGTSRDGKHFDRSWIYARKPFVERGGYGEFDKAAVWPSSQIITKGDEHLIYYTAGHSQQLGPDAENGQVGLAKLPLDRFISQSAKDELGTITTKPFKLEGNTLQVNVDAGDGRFYAEILDADGKPIPGFTVNEARIFGGIDQLRLEPWWKGQKDLTSLKGKTIRLKFYLNNAKLYAFQIKSEN